MLLLFIAIAPFPCRALNTIIVKRHTRRKPDWIFASSPRWFTINSHGYCRVWSNCRAASKTPSYTSVFGRRVRPNASEWQRNKLKSPRARALKCFNVLKKIKIRSFTFRTIIRMFDEPNVEFISSESLAFVLVMSTTLTIHLSKTLKYVIPTDQTKSSV